MSIYTSVFGLSVYQDMTRTKQTARLSTNVPPVPSNVRYVENPAYNASVENSESDETQSIECDVSKCQTPPVESNTVGSLHMWKCEPYKNEKYDPLVKVPKQGDKVKPFLYGRVVVLKLTGKSSDRVG